VRSSRSARRSGKVAEPPALTRDLRPLFDPTSVAIVGASATAGKWGNWLATNALKGKRRRRVALVNRSGGQILGEQAYRSLAEAGGPIELVVIAVGAAGFEQAVDDALAAGARAIVGITAGLGEAGGAARESERRVVERVRAAGAVLVGPNCLGVADPSSDLDLSFGDFAAGPLGLISQSGNLALELARLVSGAGLGFSRFVSVGNQADLEVTDLIDVLADHEPTRVIAVYAEEFRDGRAFARASLRASELGKPVVLLTVGTSRAGARTALSHTGALVSESTAIDAACRAAGIIRAATPREMVDLAQGLLMPLLPAGRRVAAVGDGGGHLALAADLATEQGLELPLLSADLSQRIGTTLPRTASTVNPVDLAGGGEQDFFNYARTVSMLAASGEVDSVLLTGYFGGYSEDQAELASKEAEVAAAMADGVVAAGRPLVVHSMYPASPTLAPLRAAGIPVYGDISSAVRVLARLAARAEQAPRGVPDLPVPAPAGFAVGSNPPVHAPAGIGYFAARAAIKSAGIPLMEAVEVRTKAEAVSAAASIGFPVALKALGAAHKSDGGGVRLGIAGENALAAAFEEMSSRLEPRTWSVERMALSEEGVELLVGVRRDHSFGPVLVIGMGGLYAELMRDVAVALAPVTTAVAGGLIRSLRAAPLLLGARGRPALDMAAAAEVATALSVLAAERPDLAEIEINPLLVGREGAVALDARIVPMSQ
jgi:acyl-CoA synthetase (NDP forming)